MNMLKKDLIIKVLMQHLAQHYEAKQMLKEAKEEMALRIQDGLDNEKNEGRDIWEQKHESLGRLSSNVL